MEILYQDNQIVAAIKPVGPDSEHAFPAMLLETLGGEIYPLHRLDANVGGVMLYARTKAAAARFSKLVQEGQLVKEYVALVHGTPPEEGDWQDLLWKDAKKNKVFVVDRERKGVKAARLEFAWCASGSIPAAATRSGCSFPPVVSPWWATISTAPVPKKQPPCFIAAALPSPTKAKPCASKPSPPGQNNHSPLF